MIIPSDAQPIGRPPAIPDVRNPVPSDPARRRLSPFEYPAVIVRGAKRAQRNQVSHLAQAVAFNGFLAIPSVLLLALGLFSTVAGPGSVDSLLGHLGGVVPTAAITLARGSMKQVMAAQQGGVMIVVGAALALWSLSGAMQTVMWSLNTAYEQEETRGFVRARLVSILMGLSALVAVALIVLALVLGPLISVWIGDHVGASGVTAALWNIGRFPVLVLGLLASFGIVLYLGPDVEGRRFQLVTPGAVVALLLWLAASAAFAFYANSFGSYNKAWGSLAAVIVTLTWMWLSSVALLLGAEINAEADRCRAGRGATS